MFNNNGNTIPRNGLVGEWLLDGNRNDTSGNGYNGSGSNVTYVKTTKGYQAQAGSFNGSSSLISTTYTRSGDTSPFTLTAWIYSNNTTVGPRPVGWSDSSSRNSTCSMYSFAGGSSNKMYWIIRSSAGISYDISNNSIQNANTWEMYTLTYDGSAVNIYKNGVLDGTKTSVRGIGNRALWFGRALNNSTPVFNGQLQLARIYNRVLSQDEIQLLYLEGQRKLGPTSVASYPKLLDGLVGYWDFKGSAHNLVDGVNATNTNVTTGIDHLGQTSLNTYNGTNSKLSLPGSYINLGTGDFTASFWVTLNQGGTDNVFLSNLTSSSPTGFSLCRNLSNKISLEQWNSGASTVFNTINNYATGTYFVTFQRSSGGILNIYINGVLENTGTGTVRNITSTQVCDFGRYTYNDTKFMNGKIDECIIQNRILSADEVSQLYQLSSQDYIYPAPSYSLLNLQDGLLLNLNGTNNGTTTLYDISGNGINGTVSSTPTYKRQGKVKTISLSSQSISWTSTSFTTSTCFEKVSGKWTLVVNPAYITTTGVTSGTREITDIRLYNRTLSTKEQEQLKYSKLGNFIY